MREHHIISLGAGVQSSTMLLMAIHGEITPKPELAVFADTGWEPQRVYDWLDWLKGVSESAGIPVLITSAGNIKEDMLAKASGERTGRVANPPLYVKPSPRQLTYDTGDWVYAGTDEHGEELWEFSKDGGTITKDEIPDEGKLFRYCTKEYKIEPITTAIREYLGIQPRHRVKDIIVRQWRGISLDEIIRAKVSKPDDWIQVRYPLIELEMTRHDCLLWMEKHGYAQPPKSSCIGCPFHSDDYWKAMRQFAPEEFQDAVEFDHAIRNFPSVDGEVFLHRSLKPLDEVDLRTNAEKGQMELDLFGEECEGMCGL